MGSHFLQSSRRKEVSCSQKEQVVRDPHGGPLCLIVSDCRLQLQNTVHLDQGRHRKSLGSRDRCDSYRNQPQSWGWPKVILTSTHLLAAEKTEAQETTATCLPSPSDKWEHWDQDSAPPVPVRRLQLLPAEPSLWKSAGAPEQAPGSRWEAAMCGDQPSFPTLQAAGAP
jgi:hypothetical protein